MIELQTKRKISIVFIVVFLSVLFICGAFTLRNLLYEKETVKGLYQSTGYSKELFSGIDDLYRSHVTKKQKWINIYGLTQKVLNKRIIGNMEFVKNDDGLMEIMSANEMPPTKDFADDLVRLNQMSQEKGIEFIYVQMPMRNDLSVPDSLVKAKEYYDSIRNITDKAGVFCLDGDDILTNSNLKLEDFYMKTDVHPTTEGEILVANRISSILKKKGIEINNLISGSDDSRYEKHSHELLGNLAKSVGKYYNGVDTFCEYIPVDNPNTKLEITDLTTNELIKEGVYSNTVMNGFDGINSLDIYWVVNYLQYGRYAYNIKNKISEGPNIMFICDSYSYRTISFLSLGCKNITVIDPRFVGGNEGVEEILDKEKYDVVICLHGTKLPPFLKD